MVRRSFKLWLRKEGKENMANSKSSWIGQKIEKIMSEGIRRNTHKPVSKTNKRRKVGLEQARAIAISMSKRGGM
jgi:hypothetical protein